MLCDFCDFGCSDCIYMQVKGYYVLCDLVLKCCIDICMEGSCLLVVWNFGVEVVVKMVDVGEGWCDYVCLEVVNVGFDVVILLLGGSYVLFQILLVVLWILVIW